MRELREGAFDAQVEHEGGAGVARLVDALVCPMLPHPIGDQLRHGMGEIAIHHHGVRRVAGAADLDANGAAAFKGDGIDRRGELDFDAQALGNACHRSRDLAAATARVEHPVLVFEEAQDGEQRRAAERAHAQVFGLEAEGEPHARVREMRPQISIHAAIGPHQAQRLEHVEAEQVGFRAEGACQHGPEFLQLGAVLRHEPFKVARILRAELGDFLGHARHVGGGVDGDALLAIEDQPIERIQADQVDLILKPRAAGLEDFGQDARIQEEGGPKVEAVTFRRGQHAGAAADHGILLIEGDAGTGSCQLHRSSEATGPGADHCDAGTGSIDRGRMDVHPVGWSLIESDLKTWANLTGTAPEIRLCRGIASAHPTNCRPGRRRFMPGRCPKPRRSR